MARSSLDSSWGAVSPGSLLKRIASSIKRSRARASPLRLLSRSSIRAPSWVEIDLAGPSPAPPLDRPLEDAPNIGRKIANTFAASRRISGATRGELGMLWRLGVADRVAATVVGVGGDLIRLG